MERHNLIILITTVLGCLVTFQALRSVEELDLGEAGIPLWEGSWRDELPEKYRVYKTLEGRLSQEIFPVPWFGPAPPVGEEQTARYLDVMVLEVFDSGNVTTKYYLWHGGRTGMVLAETGGSYRVGGALIKEWTTALKEGKIVEVEGYAFDVIAEDGGRYHLFHVDSVNILGYTSEEYAIKIGKYFLDGVGFKTGRVLSVKLEEKDPNFYWDIVVKSDVEWDRLDVWDRMLKYDRPEMREIRPCWIIRFEQAKRPGHFFEVWLDASEYLVVGGSSCK